MDPLTISGAIAGIKIANEAFGAVKQMIQNGRSVADCGTALGKWMQGVQAVEKEAANRGSITGDNASAKALELVSARNQVRRQRNELREWMQLYGESGSWDQFIKLERDFRVQAKKQKEDAAAARSKRAKKLKDILTAAVIVLFFVLLIGVCLIVYLNIPTAEAISEIQ